MASCATLKDGEYNLSLVTTGDGHGYWFSKPVTQKGPVRGSLMAQSEFVNGLREEKGGDNVILVDAGDNFLGNNAAFYCDYVDTASQYLYTRLASYMGYDAVVPGVVDFEAGHGVYDRAAKGFKKEGVPFLAGNVVRAKSGKAYFKTSTVVKKNGVKVAILGYANAETGSLVDASAVSGLEFESLLPLVQNDVDKVVRKSKPQVVIVVAHTAVGKGEGDNLEKQGMDLYKSLKGVDFVVAAHDHMDKVMATDSIVLMQSGKAAQSVGLGDIKIVVKNGKVVGKDLSAKVVRLKGAEIDQKMEEQFADEIMAVNEFSKSKVGEIKADMPVLNFYWAQSDYINFLHALALSTGKVDISMTATLLLDGKVAAGDVTFNDIKSVYPYANKLVVLNLTGREVLAYLEASYEQWIQTVDGADVEHILNMKQTKDWKTGGMTWKLSKSPANFDSGAGINYTVDVTKPYGSRVVISGMADGSEFSLDKTYSVGITSYRSTGAGGLLKAAGLDSAEAVAERVTWLGPEFRAILYDYLKANGSVDPAVIGDPKVVGTWKFIPNFAEEGIRKDVETLTAASK